MQAARMKLLVKVTRILTTDDLDLTCDPPLSFEVTGNVEPSIFKAVQEWEAAGFELERCAELVGRVFISVTQDGQTYSLNGKAAALALYEAIEESNPGAAYQFMVRLLENFIQNHLRFFVSRRSGSPPSAPPSENGSAPAS
jgi:hypothetical protein